MYNPCPSTPLLHLYQSTRLHAAALLHARCRTLVPPKHPPRATSLTQFASSNSPPTRCDESLPTPVLLRAEPLSANTMPGHQSQTQVAEATARLNSSPRARCMTNGRADIGCSEAKFAPPPNVQRPVARPSSRLSTYALAATRRHVQSSWRLSTCALAVTRRHVQSCAQPPAPPLLVFA